MTERKNLWTEADSGVYQRLATVAVPARAEQIATLLTLLPFDQQQFFRIVELGCGEGILAFTLLDCFPNASLVALDGSSAMRKQASERLNPFSSRCRVEPFDLTATDWLPHVQGTDGVLSSLCIHHLSGEQKQELFKRIFQYLSPHGVFLIADLVAPQRPEVGRLFAETWDRCAEAQSILQTGSISLFEAFQREKWNYYAFPDDVVDHPSPLFDQLLWLKQAGFAVVDCFWLQAGHAIYGGYKTHAATPQYSLPFETALHAVQAALRVSSEHR